MLLETSFGLDTSPANPPSALPAYPGVLAGMAVFEEYWPLTMEKVVPFGLFDVSSCDVEVLCFCRRVTLGMPYPHCITLEAYGVTPDKVDLDTKVEASLSLCVCLVCQFFLHFSNKRASSWNNLS